MELKEARCTNCGAHLNLEPQKTMATCDYCHSTIMVSNAVELALVEVDKTKDLERYRSLLKDAIQKNSIGEILRQARQIKDIIPSDFTANYYFAYAKQSGNEPSFMKAFLTSNLPGTPEEINDVVNHITNRSDLRDKPLILNFLNRVSPETVDRYEDAHKNRARQENQYANVTRDVFICHSSHDRAVAERIVEILEKEGFTCWISSRNLRPEDSENYWVNITKAIENTKILLVVSSESAMLSKDVQREIEISQKRKQKRFEYKIDDTPQTVLFKHAFDGIKWVDGSESPLGHVKKLPNRVYEELQGTKKKTKSIKVPRVSLAHSSRIKKLILPVILIVALLGVSGIVFGISGILSPSEYTVAFIDYDNEVIETLVLEEGSEIIYPNDPSRNGYTFSGWSSNPEIIEENLTLTAEYSQNIYNVVYQDHDGEVLKEAEVIEGESLDPPDAPSRTGHSFSRWSASSESITEDTVIEAIYEINTYMVTFLDHNGNIVRRETVDFGQDANPPSVTREGHTFLGWNQSTENIQSDVTLSPNYQIKTYTVTFKDYDGTVLDTLQVPYGSSAEAPGEPSREGYVFTGWNEPLSNITGDTDITAQYRDNFFEVTYKDHDGRIIQTFTVEYGNPAPTPSDPSREGYIFTGWNQTLNRVTGNADIFATYEEGTNYAVQFESDDSVVDTKTVRDGGLLAIPDVSKEGHTLDGWYTSVNGGETLDERWQFTSNTVASNLTLYAKWSINEYTITVRYNNNQNDLLITQNYGTEITIPEPNSKEGHTFEGWSTTIPSTMPGENLTIDANWDINQYTLSLIDHDDSVIETFTFDYGEDLSELNDYTVEREGYTFTGWNTLIPSKMPNEDIEFTANHTINEYILELIHDEEIIYSSMVEYGSLITPPIMSNENFNSQLNLDYLDKTIENREIILNWEDLPLHMPSRDLSINSNFIRVQDQRLNVRDDNGTKIRDIIYQDGKIYIAGDSSSTDMFFADETDPSYWRSFFLEIDNNLTPKEPIIFNDNATHRETRMIDFANSSNDFYFLNIYEYYSNRKNIVSKLNGNRVDVLFTKDIEEFGEFQKIHINEENILVHAIKDKESIIYIFSQTGLLIDSIILDYEITSSVVSFEDEFIIIVISQINKPKIITKLNYNLDIIQSTEFQTRYNSINSIYVSSENEIYLIGSQDENMGEYNSGESNGLLIIFDNNLDFVNEFNYGGSDYDNFHDIAEYDNSLIIVGRTRSDDGAIVDSYSSYDSQGWFIVLDKYYRVITSITIGLSGNETIDDLVVGDGKILLSMASDFTSINSGNPFIIELTEFE